MGGSLYFNGSGTRILEGGPKVEIMNELEGGALGFGELVERLSLAKSTVSNHLTDLESAGLILMWPDERDGRRKVVRSDSRRVAYTGEVLEIEAPLRERLEASIGDREGFLKATILVLRYHAYLAGIDMNPGMREAGRIVGSEVGKQLEAGSRDELLESLSDCWEEHGMGKLDYDYPFVVFDNGFGCEKIPGPEVCGFYEGLFEGVVSSSLGEDVAIVTRGCGASGSGRCRFEVSG